MRKHKDRYRRARRLARFDAEMMAAGVNRANRRRIIGIGVNLDRVAHGRKWARWKGTYLGPLQAVQLEQDASNLKRWGRAARKGLAREVAKAYRAAGRVFARLPCRLEEAE